jgi:predicted ATPase
MGDRSEFWILTGAPGSGKTAILDAIRGGVRCVDEPARRVLAEQRAIDGRGTPDRDPSIFVHLLLERAIEDHEEAQSGEGPVLFDRGLPDCVAYAVLLAVDARDAQAAAERYRYGPEVFLLEPWEDIYVTDHERTMSFADTVAFQALILEAYRRTGYELVSVPRADVGTRVAFVRSRILRPDD